jgi:hypothetical protein
MFFFQAPEIVAQAPNPNCYYPESPRQCQVVAPVPEVAQPPVVTEQVASAGTGSSLARFAPIGLALPLLAIPFIGGGGDDPTGGGTLPEPPQPIPGPTIIPGLLLGAGALWAARRRRAAFIVVPFFLFPVASAMPTASLPSFLAQQNGQELVFPVISNNSMSVNYGGRVVNLPIPAGLPRDTAKYRYFAQAVDGGGWKICWEEVKPLICPPRQAPRRLLGLGQS